MTQDNFRERFNSDADFLKAMKEIAEDYNSSHAATADDVQNAISLISRAGFEIDAMAYEYARLGRQQLAAGFASGLYEDNTEHAFFYRRGDERLYLSWDYKFNTAKISLKKILPGEFLCRAENHQDFSLTEFAAYIHARENTAPGSTSPAPGAN